jgi:hypothetical protein
MKEGHWMLEESIIIIIIIIIIITIIIIIIISSAGSGTAWRSPFYVFFIDMYT